MALGHPAAIVRAVCGLAFLLILGGAPSLAPGETPAEEALRLISLYHEDPTRIDRARDVLERAVARDRQIDTIIALSRVHFLVGEIRAQAPEDKLAAYERGRELGQRAVELAPKSEDAHFWYAANTGRFGQTKGVLRSLILLPTMREEIDALLAINPRSARAHGVAGNFFFEVPGLLGGDRVRAEQHWKKGIEIDPHYTILHVDYARFLIAAGRTTDARLELQRVVDETAPTNRADWAMRDLPRARVLLESVKDKK